MKFLPLLLIIAGIIVISGCTDTGNQHSASEAPVSLYRSIFYPYAGLENLSDAISLLDRNIQQADLITMKFEEGIKRYKAEGKDVSRVEALLERYKFLVEEAKKYRALADKTDAEGNNSLISDSNLEDSSLENGSSKHMKKEYLIESQNCMIQANDALKEIFNEFQRLMPGNADLNSTSRLNASGEGMINLRGGFTLNLHIEEGEIAVPFYTQDFEIDIKGNYSFEKRTEMHDNVLLYHIHSADAKISGSRKAVMIRGKNLTLTTYGEGFATFLGNGVYSIEETGGVKTERNWAHPPFTEGTSPREQALNGTGGYESDEKNHEVFLSKGRSNIIETDKRS